MKNRMYKAFVPILAPFLCDLDSQLISERLKLNISKIKVAKQNCFCDS